MQKRVERRVADKLMQRMCVDQCPPRIDYLKFQTLNMDQRAEHVFLKPHHGYLPQFK